MLISEMLKRRDVTVSFEVFPPKTDSNFEPVLEAVEKLSSMNPAYMSVTYGAGGGTSKHTVEIASHIENKLNTTALAHLTCVSSDRDETAKMAAELKQKGIKNILALRGDIPQNQDFPRSGYYKYAYQLVHDLKETGDFCIGAACYPEGHTECVSKEADLDFLKEKVNCGCDFLVTQMFFDNSILYSFLYNALKKGIDLPVTAGIMPVTNSRQIKRIVELSGAALPAKFKSIMDKFGKDDNAMRQAGIIYATDQIVDLIANGVKGIHIYTMNKPEIAFEIVRNLSEIIKL